MAMMAGLTATPRDGRDDCNSSVEESDMTPQEQQDRDYQREIIEDCGETGEQHQRQQSDDEMEEGCNTAADITTSGIEDDISEELPTQVKVRQGFSYMTRCEV